MRLARFVVSAVSLAAPVLAPVLALGVGGCARSGPPAAAATEPPSIHALEDEILRDLAAIDRRLAQRARVEPSAEDIHRIAVAAMLREDTTVAVVDGAIDPFSFDARARALAAAREKIARLPERSSPPGERALLARLVDGETVRLEEERALPRSASALVRAVSQTWTPAKDAKEAADDDRWLARRLALVRESMTAPEKGRELDVVRARELDDALDVLERLAAGMVVATQELVRIREALENAGSQPAAKATSDWAAVAKRAAIHVGVDRAPDVLARELDDLERDLRSRAEKAVADARIDGDYLAEALAKNVFVTGPCADAIEASRVRAMAAPPERAPSCHLRHLVAAADDDGKVAIALAAMHEHVMVATWALDVARGASPIAEAEAKHRSLVPLGLETRARLERFALARPVAALAAGLTVQLLVAGDPRARATAWARRIGDVPLDVAARELR